MVLSQADTQKIVDQVSDAIGRSINIMDETGVILASTNPARIGQLHGGARKLLDREKGPLPRAARTAARRREERRHLGGLRGPGG